MNEPLPVSALSASAWHDFRRAWGALVVYEAFFKLLEAWLFVPALAVLLSAVLSRSGRLAVSNRDALDFLLSPSGLLYAALFGTTVVALLLWEQAGLMALAASSVSPRRLPIRQALSPPPGRAGVSSSSAPSSWRCWL